MKSRVRTEYAAGVSFRSVERRPPASALAATNPRSRSEFTVKGESSTISFFGASEAESEALPMEVEVVWAEADVATSHPAKTENRLRDFTVEASADLGCGVLGAVMDGG